MQVGMHNCKTIASTASPACVWQDSNAHSTLVGMRDSIARPLVQSGASEAFNSFVLPHDRARPAFHPTIRM